MVNKIFGENDIIANRIALLEEQFCLLNKIVMYPAEILEQHASQ